MRTRPCCCWIRPRFVAIAAVACLAGLSGEAQLAIDKDVIAGGGGVSSGGSFTLTDTVAQPAIGPVAASGRFELKDGYWAVVTALQTVGGPRLNVEALGGGGVKIFWSSKTLGYVLDQADTVAGNPSETAWSVVSPDSYQTNATQIFIHLPTPDTSKFFRLRKP